MVGAIALTERIAGSGTRLTSAAESADVLLSLPHLVPAMALTARSARALIAVQRNESEVAEEQYRAIEPQNGTACFIMPVTFDRLLALLAVTCGQIDTAVAHFEDGLSFCERAGYRPEHAWTAYDYAKTLLIRDRQGDREKAGMLQGAALSTARELNMRPLIERVLDQRK
jgi:ATP/maltotriose-dependent transcriptional regulator MalT